MKNYLYVFLGGGIGAGVRYWLGGVIPKYLGSNFPYGIFLINIIGCFFIGLLMAAFEERFAITPSLRIFLTIGILGGFTTFSSFSYEAISLLRDAEILRATVYVGGSVVLGLIGAYAGSVVGKLL